MPFTKYLYALLCIAIALFTSCSAGRNLVYFSDLTGTSTDQTPIQNRIETKIESGDLLSIIVSSLNAETNLMFNSGILLPAATGGGAGTAATNRINEGYLVDSNGEINLPTIGKIKMTGLTKEEAADKITTIVGKSAKSPIVTVRFLNFRVTVIGEVNRPATFTVPSEKINVLEALGLAGDMTGYGRRDDVLIIREKNNVRTTTRINLNNKSVLNSPFFYLQQNDIVYVEPDHAKALQVSTRSVNLPIYLSVASVLLFFLTTVLYR
ncbi:polysaccharide biosynthesis/export family protein [Hymenobacter caeli]|uniref:Polysaccharide export outer membrane protein n=1 Tax=Hymenobacter caeli TaxID=2735894 RepID=A0ABX2FQF4_9BACT|nr:polysaccharide biosynthesis/export family protein [Hymenobacter caeli]NRT18677.1 polysaccharide export outer membrane protein [Hymenobacter caeli]